ncbi:mitogen-activated protein kinase kinase kinase 3-like isoform X3 [Tasmannia lanceolata]|uniref:mitogen-activated protein kinase kinase kinase 3-like isoform X3 n=1 Tax=Tasmannia lanceolata TaxID=3420 RepID=UPI0040635385
MPVWWGKKSNSNKKKEEQQEALEPIKERRKGKEKTKSFDEIFNPKSSNNSASGTRSAPSFDSDRLVEKRAHPLPQPSSLFSPFESVSSVSSSASSDDPPDLGIVGLYRYPDPMNTSSGRSVTPNSRSHHVSTTPPSEHPRLTEPSSSPRSDFHLHGYVTPPNGNTYCTPKVSTETTLSPRSRSPGPGSRGHSLLASPLHPQACGFSSDSPMEKQEDGRSPCHPLPLPPGSPNSSSPRALRNIGVNDNVHCLHSRWKKGRLLGRGTFGHVYAGFNSESGQMCAIKEVRVISDDRNSEECLRQLNQEITLLSQLAHPNIVQYYGSELAQGTLSVYLEYISGGSIHKLLQEYGPFGEPVIQSYTGQILSGLAYLHERNTVHRDIKGANILVDPNGAIKLADFGMAKHITSCSSVLSFKGSPYWMAPEVIMNCNGYNLAVDIWSLGCTVLEMATSKPPWSQYEGVAAIFKIGNSKEIPQIPDYISDNGKDFLKLCLQRDPSARPTAAKLLEHPFVRDHATTKVSRININKDIMHSSSDGIRMLQNAVEFQSNRMNIHSHDEDYGMRDTVGFPMAYKNSSDHASLRMNMSLPVSPCSSPLQQLGPSHRSCFLSPPPTYTMGMGGYDLTTHSVFPPRINANINTKLNANYPDPWPDISQLSIQTPKGSPTARQGRSLCL